MNIINSNELQLLKNIIKIVNENIDELKENEVVKLFESISPIFGGLQKTAGLISQKLFLYFLKGFCENEPSEKRLKKLEKFVVKKEKSEFIANIFKKVLMSNSIKSSMILGSIVYMVVEEDENLDYELLVIINALGQFLDEDIENFSAMMNHQKVHRIKGKDPFFFIPEIGIKENTSLYYTIEKSVSNQLISVMHFSEINDILPSNPNEEIKSISMLPKYVINSIGGRFYKLICRIEY